MAPASSQFDAAIIGGGVIGCTIAWRLSQAGMRVVVIERGEIGQEASWAAGGMLAPLAEANRADAFLDLVIRSCAMYGDFARELREMTGIDIAYRTEGTLYLALSDADEEELEHRWQWQCEAGLNIKKLNADDVRNLEPAVTPTLRWALRFPDDHQVDNRQLMVAVAAAAKKASATFLLHTEAHDIVSSNSQVSAITTSQGTVQADTVILAAGCWSDSLTINGTRVKNDFLVEPVRGQMIALEMPEPRMQHVIYSSNGYLVPRHGGYVIAGSTTEKVGYDKRVTASGIASIIDHAIEIAPNLAAQSVRETWAGLRPKTKDEWPILGTDPGIKGLIYATGHYRNGILLTPLTGQAISELVTRGESTVNLTPFNVARFDQDLRRSA